MAGVERTASENLVTVISTEAQTLQREHDSAYGVQNVTRYFERCRALESLGVALQALTDKRRADREMRA